MQKADFNFTVLTKNKFLCLQVRGAIQAEDLVNILNNTPSIRNFYKCKPFNHF